MHREVDSPGLRDIIEHGADSALVLFYGDWCSDCRSFEPLWDKWTAGRSGPIFMVAVSRGGKEWLDWNIDEIPTVVAFKNGAEVDRAHGTIGEDDLDRLWQKTQ